MKQYLLFFVKSIFVGIFFLEATNVTSIGHELVGSSIADPIYMSLCGLGLLYLGFYRKKQDSNI